MIFKPHFTASFQEWLYIYTLLDVDGYLEYLFRALLCGLLNRHTTSLRIYKDRRFLLTIEN
jgi:hypothetical protein